MKRIFFLIFALFAWGLAGCQSPTTLSPAMPTSTVTFTPQPTLALPTDTRTPPPTSTNTFQPTPTRTLLPTVTRLPTKTNTPTATPFPDPVSFPISPANGPDKWPLYNSANQIRVLLFDGTYIWAGSVEGGLTQWEPRSLTSTRHTRATGFPMNTVYDLDYDEQSGYLYAVGDLGLAIWDGKSWLHRPQKYLGFAPDLPLTAVLADHDTMIWVGAEEEFYYEWDGQPVMRGGGLAYGNWAGGEWLHFSPPNAPSNNQINDLLLDGNGNMWVACGVYDYSPAPGGVSVLRVDGNWAHYRSTTYENPGDLAGYEYHSLALGNDGTIYAGGDVISYLMPGADQWVSRDTSAGVLQIAVDASGNIWYPDCTDEECFAWYGNGANTWNVEKNMPSWDAIAIDGDGDFWLGNPAILEEMVDGEVQPRMVAGSLPRNPVEQVAVNGDDSVWFISTNGEYSWRKKQFVSRLADGKITNFWSERQAIEAAYPWTGRDALWAVGSDGTIWIQDGGGEYDLKTHKITDYLISGYDGETWHTLPPIPDIKGAPSQPIVGRDGTIAVIHDAGLSLYIPGVGWQEPTWPWERGMPMNTSFGKMMFDQQGVIWITDSIGFFMARDKVFRYSPDTKEWHIFTMAETGIHYVPPKGIGLSPTGELWLVGLYGDGQVGVYQEDGTWKTTALEPYQNWAEVYFGIDGSPWFTTVVTCGFEADCINGLVYFDEDRAVHLTIENSGLNNGWVNDLSFDSAGNIWLATGAGLQMMPRP